MVERPQAAEGVRTPAASPGGMNRRRFLQVCGGAAAFAATGAALLGLPQGPAATKGGEPAFVDGGAQQTMITPEEATRLRHLRHRRQAFDGVVDVTGDSYLDCEHHCTGGMFAHQLDGGTAPWL